MAGAGGTFALYSLLCRHIGILPGSRQSKVPDPADVLLSAYSSASELGTPAGPKPRRRTIGARMREGIKKSPLAQSVQALNQCWTRDNAPASGHCFCRQIGLLDWGGIKASSAFIQACQTAPNRALQHSHGHAPEHEVVRPCAAAPTSSVSGEGEQDFSNTVPGTSVGLLGQRMMCLARCTLCV